MPSISSLTVHDKALARLLPQHLTEGVGRHQVDVRVQAVHGVPGGRLVGVGHLPGVQREGLAGVQRDQDGTGERVDLVAAVSVLQVVQDARLVEVREVGQVRDALLKLRVGGRHQRRVDGDGVPGAFQVDGGGPGGGVRGNLELARLPGLFIHADPDLRADVSACVFSVENSINKDIEDSSASRQLC